MTTVEPAIISDLRAQLESIIRACKNLSNNNCEEAFLKYLTSQETLRLQWLETENEYRKLKEKHDSAVKDISVLENKLRLARRLVDEEKIRSEKIARERDTLVQQLAALRQILSRDHPSELPENAKKELIFLESSASEYLDAESSDRREHSNFVCKSDSVDGVSKLPAVRLDNDLDDDDGLALPIKSTPAKYSLFVKDLNGRADVKMKSPNAGEVFAKGVGKENKENSPMVANTPGMFTPNRYSCSSIFVKSPTVLTPSNRSNNVSRHHNFIIRSFLMPESCTRCYRKIAFGRVVLKCTDCAIVIHPECRDDILPACKLYFSSPSKDRSLESLSYYVNHALPPFVPPFVVNCIKEIERRGMLEENLYRMMGAEPLVHRLLESVRFSTETKLNFVNYDTHSICRALISFFENLKEPLIPRTSWETFAGAVTHSDLMLAASTLPRVNRDTLAFLVVHLQNVLLESGSSAEHLSEVFRSVIFGRECRELEYAGTVVRELILLPAGYWNRFAPASSTSLLTSTPSKCDFVEKTFTYFSPMTASSSGKKRYFNARV